MGPTLPHQTFVIPRWRPESQIATPEAWRYPRPSYERTWIDREWPFVALAITLATSASTFEETNPIKIC